VSDCFQQSRVIILAIPVVLLFVQVCSGFGPVVAIDMSFFSADIPQMVLTPGSTSLNSSVHLNITSNTPNWTVSVKDASDDSKPPSNAGRMVEWDGISAYVSNPAILGANMTVTGATVAGSSGSTVTLSGANQIIEIGTAEVTSLEIPITFGQAVAYTDPHLTVPNHAYRIVVTFTGATT
jgi:hypothetical protein